MIRVHGVPPLWMCLSAYFLTTVELNVLLHLHYVCVRDNPADLPSRHLSTIDSLQREFGGDNGHTCDFVALP